jgi:hypothetical protein
VAICVVDLLTVNYRVGIFQTFITSGRLCCWLTHC